MIIFNEIKFIKYIVNLNILFALDVMLNVLVYMYFILKIHVLLRFKLKSRTPKV